MTYSHYVQPTRPSRGRQRRALDFGLLLSPLLSAHSSKTVSLRCLISSPLPARRATRKNYTKSRKTAGGLHPRPGQSGTREGNAPLSPRCFIGYNLESELVTERCTDRISGCWRNCCERRH